MSVHAYGSGNLVCDKLICASVKNECNHIHEWILEGLDVPLAYPVTSVPITTSPWFSVMVGLDDEDMGGMRRVNLLDTENWPDEIDTMIGYINSKRQGRLALRDLIIPTLWQLAQRPMPVCTSKFHDVKTDPHIETSGINGRFLQELIFRYLTPDGKCQKCIAIESEVIPSG